MAERQSPRFGVLNVPMTFDLSEATELLRRTPSVLRTLLDGLPDPWLTCSEGEGTFRPIDVVGHLVQGERTDWIPRARRILEDGEARPFEPFDRFGHEDEVARLTAGELLDAFERARKESLSRLEELGLSDADLARKGTHPDLGTVTLAELLSTWVVHDLSHLRQICRVMAKRHADDVGPWRAYLPVVDEGR